MRLKFVFAFFLYCGIAAAQKHVLYKGNQMPAPVFQDGNEFHLIADGGIHGIGIESGFSFDESHFIYAGGNTRGRPSPQNGNWQRYGEIAIGYFDPLLAMRRQYNAFALGFGAGNGQGVDSIGDYSYSIKRYFIEAHIGGRAEYAEGQFMLRTGFAQINSSIHENAAIISALFSANIGPGRFRLHTQVGFDFLAPAPYRISKSQFPVTAAAGIEWVVGRSESLY